MAKIVGKLWILAALVTIPLVFFGLLFFFHSRTETTVDNGVNEPGISDIDFSTVPQSVLEDATGLAKKMIGEGREGYQELIDQLLAMYLQVKDKDVAVVFNSGGWGWNIISDTPGWSSILDGIQSKLDSLGYRSLVLNHKRTSEGILAALKEFLEGASKYPSKGKDLASRVEFLTRNVPDLKVIVAGESNGTVIVDSAMNILQNNTQVYSIQTGTPFWHQPVALDRTLLMTDNGLNRDTFSHGNVPAMVWASIKDWLGLSSPDDIPGHVMSFIRAPGHDYSWQYPGVYAEVVDFLEKNFGVKSDG